jgi:hypothetical protein
MNQSIKQNLTHQALPALSSMLKLCLTSAALAWSLAASADTFTTTTNFTVGAMIPDGNASGLANVQTVSTPITNLTGLRVALKVSGTWNGDLYCFLAHGTNQAVLLNRLGRSEASNLGYNDAGLNLIFDDSATNSDVHVYRLQLAGNNGSALAAPLTDSWAPDARVSSPIGVLDTDARAAFLGSFEGVDPNGEWVLFVADMEAGDIHTVESWGLEFTGDTAPSISE